MSKLAKKSKGAILCLLLVGMLLLVGCRENVPAASTSQIEAGGQRLSITGTKTEEIDGRDYTLPGTDRTVSVFYFDNATIEVDGQPVQLQKAVEQGMVMPEEIAAWARLDAIDGYCDETVSSEKGLTTFLYSYKNQFVVQVINDVLESPDGKQHHIETVDIYAPNRSIGSVVYYNEEGQPLAKEDWGITLALEGVTATGATLVATQSGGGQQVGKLLLESFTLYSVNTDSLVHKKDGTVGNTIDGKVSVERDTTERVALDWSEAIGELPSGSYIMEVTVLDVFDKDSVHPLIVKYQYSQNHKIELTIP